jgi:hypothetical protein
MLYLDLYFLVIFGYAGAIRYIYNAQHSALFVSPESKAAHVRSLAFPDIIFQNHSSSTEC